MVPMAVSCTPFVPAIQALAASYQSPTSSFACDAGLLYCMEFLEQNMDWLKQKLDPLIEGEMTANRPLTGLA